MAAPLVGLGIALATFIWQLLRYITPYIVGWVLSAIGIGFITYFGMNELVEYAIDMVRVRFSDIPATALELLKMTGIFKAFNIFVGGITAGLTVKFSFWNAGRVKKFVLKA
jgi:hypothetical protein